MPEKPEVLTVVKKLKLRLLGKKFYHVTVLYDNIIEGISPRVFEEKLIGEKINDITTRGKWIVFHLDHFLLLTHLRMEGKFYYRNVGEVVEKHQHVIFNIDNEFELRFVDTRKFGKMMLLDKENYLMQKPFTELGYEYNDTNLTALYLKEKLSRKTLPIKSVLLDQSIITGIGNIYADEILFLSNIHPLTKSKDLSNKDLDAIIKNTYCVLEKAIAEGGTTIRSYTSEEGVTGLFQNNLLVHERQNEACKTCGSIIEKIKVGGRGTYYCPKCQKERSSI